jgi:hypothetical protein
MFSMCGLCPATRLEEWHSSLVRMMRKLPPDHPLRSVDGSSNPATRDRDYISHSLLSAPRIMSTFELDNQQRPRNMQQSWKSYIVKYRQQVFLKQPGILQHYIRPSARTNGLDVTLFAHSPEAESAMKKWRLNKAFLNVTCTCGSRFTRSHVECFLDDEIRASADYLLFSSSHDVQEEIRNELKTKSGNHSSFTYTYLDFLLNERRIGRFVFLFSLITSRTIHR